MFRSMFRPYGPVWNFFNRITDVLLLSLMWCAFSLPLVTIAPATAALYDAVVRGVRSGDESCWRRFLHTFRNEWKAGLLMTLLWGVILLFGAYVLLLLNDLSRENTSAALMGGAYRMLMLLPLAAASWSVILLSRVTGGFAALTGNALRFLPGHLLSSLLMAAAAWLTFWYCSNYPIGLTFAPAVCALAWSFPAERVLEKYGAGLRKQEEAE